MKPLKLNWKRTGYSESGKETGAAYLVTKSVNLGNVLQVYYRVMATKYLKRPRGTDPWRVEIRVSTIDQAWDFYHNGKTFAEVKALAFKEINDKLESMKKKAEERGTLISQISAIYKKHGQKIISIFGAHTTPNLREHLAALQDGKFNHKNCAECQANKG